ncbi:MAG: B12-binding domain-containing radical SAM protein [Bacteroidetes bacterium]|jgi:anaerobic magnesium-protoporphyrin IX monomethyl ester cyclase|nr:B12-binding domain-containing radical SAM protein [Bacteroidota bacterium]
MLICLIKPPQTYLADPERNPPLGLMYIGSVAENLGHTVNLVDLSSKTDSDEYLSFIPDAEVYGFTVSVMDYKVCHQLAAELKERRQCLVIFGGMFPTCVPELVNYDVVNSIIIGEGERAFKDLLSDISEKKILSRKYISPQIENLDSISFPLRKGTNFINTSLLSGNLASTTIITTRGCPFECAFCASNSIWGRNVRFRSSQNVLKEIDTLIEGYNVEGLRFLDDTMTLRLDFFKKLCYGLKERSITWRCSTKSNLVTKDLAQIMYDSGCDEVGIGIESADQGILDFMNKKVKVKQHEAAIRILKNAGIRITCFFMTGLPGESESTPDLNLEFIKKTNPDRVFCTTFMPYPGTDVWNNPEKYKIRILSRDFTKYHMVSGVGEEDREFIAIPYGMTQEKLYLNRKKMIDFLSGEGKIRR